MTMPYKLKKTNGKAAQNREQTDADLFSLISRQGRSVFLAEVEEWMAAIHGYGKHRTRAAIQRLVRRKRGPRLQRCGIGRYEARGA